MQKPTNNRCNTFLFLWNFCSKHNNDLQRSCFILFVWTQKHPQTKIEFSRQIKVGKALAFIVSDPNFSISCISKKNHFQSVANHFKIRRGRWISMVKFASMANYRASWSQKLHLITSKFNLKQNMIYTILCCTGDDRGVRNQTLQVKNFNLVFTIFICCVF